MRARKIHGVAAILALLTGGCDVVLGLEHRQLYQPDGGSGTGGTTATTTSTTGGPTCSDGVKNGVETDKDCGGGTCDPCQNGQGCIVGPDCQSKQCQGGTCVAFSCLDKVKNGSETDVDCGGGTCNRCDIGQLCLVSTDCVSDICKTKVCKDPHVWSEGFESMGPGEVTDVAVDNSGNVGLALDLIGVFDFGGGPLTGAGLDDDIAVAKFDSSGNHLWSKRFGDFNGQLTRGIVFDPAGAMLLTGYLAGTADFGGGPISSAGGCCPSSSDVFIAKFDVDGNHVWSKRFGDSSPQEALGVASDSQGNVLVTGKFFASMNFGDGVLTSGGKEDIFVAKLNPSGATLWSRSYGDAATQYGERVASDGSGNLIVSGAFQGTLDFGIGGKLVSNGGFDIFVVKMSANGTPVWSVSYGSDGDETHPSIAVDAAGDVFITSAFLKTINVGKVPLTSVGGNDLLLAKIAPDGKFVWSKQFGDAKDQVVHSGPRVSVDAAGNVVLTGGFAGTIDFGGGAMTSAGEDDVFVVKFDPAGKHMWSRHYGDIKNQGSNGIAVSGPENVVIAGNFDGSLDFGGAPLMSASSHGIFVTKLLLP